MSRLLQILFCLFLFLPGCKHEEPNPELLDPIYTDLLKQLQDDAAKQASEKKALLKAQEELENADPNTLDLKNALRDIARTKKHLEALDQKSRYDRIRVGRRLAEDHLNYHEAFAAGKDWPEKDEYADYLMNQKLLAAPRDWNDRVPKLFQRKPAAVKVEKKKQQAE